MKFFKKIMVIFVILLAIVGTGAFFFLQQAVFGKHPSGARLERVKKSKQYRDGQFQNASETPMMSDDVSSVDLLKEYVFGNGAQTEPPKPLPSHKQDLKALVASANPATPLVVWFGHSSYLIRIAGKTLLIDPVFSKRASPLSFAGSAAYAGTSIYAASDMPPLDAVIITHDHYDHLDYETILKLAPTTAHFHTSLGVGEHLEHWGIAEEKISEYDWWEEGKISAEENNEIRIIATPARHFSGRGIVRAQTLWSSFVLKTATHSLYLGGDSGYDTHFTEIGAKYGPFDLALLECGQYNLGWKLIHFMPEEVVQAAQDLRAKALMPVHWGKFTLALHAWDEPIRRITKAAKERGIPIATPRIGETVFLNSARTLPQEAWWEAVR
ncbi:MAG: MBL fold metallo-hydrolase [Candidatus Kapaibacterium sp.]|nr:MAG: MBL fold metallo-hydrolase [Candidatus Kapabacteria bacterium]